eukprot:CAMPEP_0170754270 /NCGR_PEP_ID=MMETSP0437-20130122/12919_1 /TAXON_ID=0 /ORGANISM="Sexangularia sp." /LENGTH=882 /DNA_ID=CAMNT_0011093409 /DNA_START=153 /DNA_END=2799 /DNA_ORIENTATION=-
MKVGQKERENEQAKEAMESGGGELARSVSAAVRQPKKQGQADLPGQQPILLQGWLDKKGSKRYFTLSSRFLSWSRDARGESIGRIALARSRLEIGGKRGHFTLSTPQKSYALAGRSADEAARWFDALRVAIESANAEQQRLLQDAVKGSYFREGPLRVGGSRRWFVLRDTTLVEYSSEKDSSGKRPPRESLSLAGCNVTEDAHGTAVFYLVSGARRGADSSTAYECTDRTDTMKWVAALTGAIAKANSVSPASGKTGRVVGAGLAATDAHAASAQAAASSSYSSYSSSSTTSARIAYETMHDFDDDIDEEDGPVVAAPGLVDVYRDGFLDKKGSQRWFLLADEYLRWAERPTTTEFIGTIRLATATVETDAKTARAIHVRLPGHSYELRAKTPAEAAGWLADLEKGAQIGRARMAVALEAATEAQLLLHRGFLLRNRKEKLFFVLQDETLFAFKSDVDESDGGGGSLRDLKGSWDLFGAAAAQDVKTDASLGIFHVSGVGMSLELQAAGGAAEAKRWVTMITAAAIRAERRGPLSKEKKSKEERAAELEGAASARALADERAAVIAAMPAFATVPPTAYVPLCTAYLSEDLVRSVVKVLRRFGTASDFVTRCVETELASCEQESTLFRTDSLATKSVGALLRVSAAGYLRATLGPLITSVCSSPSGYEVDPAKIPASEDPVENMHNLRDTAERALEVITDSLPDVPREVRVLLARIKAAVTTKFPESRLKSVGAFFFLRFVCPAIFSPEGFAIIDNPPDKQSRRALILISKAVQNLANGVKFGKKEEFMADLNPYVLDNVEEIFLFLDELSTVHRSRNSESDGTVTDLGTEEDSNEAWTRIAKAVAKHATRGDAEAARLNLATPWAVLKEAVPTRIMRAEQK